MAQEEIMHVPMVVNHHRHHHVQHLLRDLIQRGLWNDDMRMQLIAHNGSVQNLEMPSDLKELYKTVWEIKQRTVLDMAAARGIYIDQSQSLNIHMVDATTHDVLLLCRFAVDTNIFNNTLKVCC